MCMTITKLLTAAIPLLGKFCDAFWKQSKNTFKTRLSQQKEAIFSVKRREISSSELYRQVKLVFASWLGSACLPLSPKGGQLFPHLWRRTEGREVTYVCALATTLSEVNVTLTHLHWHGGTMRRRRAAVVPQGSVWHTRTRVLSPPGSHWSPITAQGDRAAACLTQRVSLGLRGVSVPARSQGVRGHSLRVALGLDSLLRVTDAPSAPSPQPGPLFQRVRRDCPPRTEFSMAEKQLFVETKQNNKK